LETGRWFKWRSFTLIVSFQTNLDGNSIDIDEYGGIAHQGRNGFLRSEEPKILSIALQVILS
jgi:hypothetical protein